MFYWTQRVDDGAEGLVFLLGLTADHRLFDRQMPHFAKSRNVGIPCPVCLTVGEADKTGKVRTYNERWHREDGHPLHIVEGASHNANYDQPDEMNRLL